MKSKRVVIALFISTFFISCSNNQNGLDNEAKTSNLQFLGQITLTNGIESLNPTLAKKSNVVKGEAVSISKIGEFTLNN
ncbi:hypothetical protein MWU59_09280 [Flavobacteriaceae bacterium F08102]|nr:hypothetical protein [Flavobacteriaceae bacterium F08102]